MDIEQTFGFSLSLRDAGILVLLAIFFIFVVSEINLNKSLSTQFLVAAFGLTPIVAFIYQTLLRKSVENKVNTIVYSIWSPKSQFIKDTIDWINNEINNKSADLNKIEKKTDKLSDEITSLRIKADKYNYKKYTFRSIIFSVLSGIMFLINLAYTGPAILQLNTQQGWYPINFSVSAFILFLIALWYMFRIIFAWNYIQNFNE